MTHREAASLYFWLSGATFDSERMKFCVLFLTLKGEIAMVAILTADFVCFKVTLHEPFLSVRNSTYLVALSLSTH